MFTFSGNFRDEAEPGAARIFDPKGLPSSVRQLGLDVSSMAIKKREF